MALNVFARLWKKLGVDECDFATECTFVESYTKTFACKKDQQTILYETTKQELETAHKEALEKLQKEHEEQIQQITEDFIESCKKHKNFSTIATMIKTTLDKNDDFQQRMQNHRYIESMLSKAGPDIPERVSLSMRQSREALDKESQEIGDEVRTLFCLTNRYGRALEKNDFTRLKEAFEALSQEGVPGLEATPQPTMCLVESVYGEAEIHATYEEEIIKKTPPFRVPLHLSESFNEPLQAVKVSE